MGTETTRDHPVAAVMILIIAAVLAAFATLLHMAITAEYGDVTVSTTKHIVDAFLGLFGVVLALVAALCLAAFALSSRWWIRIMAIATPIAMSIAGIVGTPIALQDKLNQHYQPAAASTSGAGGPSGPECLLDDYDGMDIMEEADRRSQEIFDSIQHVGYFGGGGKSGVGGCDRPIVVIDDTDIMEHYRTTLPQGGWQIVDDEGQHLRAERDGMAFEVLMCDNSRGIVWAGDTDLTAEFDCNAH